MKNEVLVSGGNVYHLPSEEDPLDSRCRVNGNYWTKDLDLLPDRYRICSRCEGTAKDPSDVEQDRGSDSILTRARHGSPEDFGLKEFPR